MQMHTIDCSPIGCYQVSLSFRLKRLDASQKRLPCGSPSPPKIPWPEPGGFLRRVQPHLYLSSLERGLKSPTLSKIVELCEVMEVHPLTLLSLAYGRDSKGVQEVLARVQRELASLPHMNGK
jgi:hypothetical protein